MGVDRDLHLVEHGARDRESLLEQILEWPEAVDRLLEISPLRSELGFVFLDRPRGRLQLGAEVAVVIGDGPGEVRGTSTVDDAVGLEHRIDPLVVADVELHRAHP